MKIKKIIAIVVVVLLAVLLLAVSSLTFSWDKGLGFVDNIANFVDNCIPDKAESETERTGLVVKDCAPGVDWGPIHSP